MFKKTITLVLLSLFIVTASYALEFEANGYYRIRMFNSWGGGGGDDGMTLYNFGNIEDDDDFDQYIEQRTGLQLTADNGDGIKGVVFFEMGDAMWGDENSYARVGGGDNSADVEVLNAYIEIDKWLYAKLGVFQLDTPNSVIFSQETAGILIGKDFDNFGVNFLYSRLYDGGYDKVGYDNDDNGDLYGVMVPMKTDYFNVTPYFLYSHVSHNGHLYSYDTVGNLVDMYQGDLIDEYSVNRNYTIMGKSFSDDSFHTTFNDMDAFWIGAAFDGRIPYGNGIDWKLHGVYGSAEVDARTGSDLEMEGFLIDGSLTYIYDRYKFDVYGLYSSGFDGGDYDDRDLGIMPTISPDYMVYGTYATFFFDSLALASYAYDPTGFSMIGGQVTFNTTESLKHIFDVAYIWNMIDEDVISSDRENILRDQPSTFNQRYMYDGFVQIALVSEYQLLEGTTLSMLAGALIPEANRDAEGRKFEDDTVYALNFKFQYNF
ncbi:MAG: hypothetical protein SVN78_00040 [Deferribacterota bacterium]|nr:hypothetical protein [Deferribacterota bacterium]